MCDVCLDFLMNTSSLSLSSFGNHKCGCTLGKLIVRNTNNNLIPHDFSEFINDYEIIDRSIELRIIHPTKYLKYCIRNSLRDLGEHIISKYSQRIDIIYIKMIVSKGWNYDVNIRFKSLYVVDPAYIALYYSILAGNKHIFDQKYDHMSEMINCIMEFGTHGLTLVGIKDTDLVSKAINNMWKTYCSRKLPLDVLCLTMNITIDRKKYIHRWGSDILKLDMVYDINRYILFKCLELIFN